ncbi:MAG: TolC family protein [Pseudoflavonifractor sp.]|nr:TolC family protein [Pseudoflavonifractor sp.]
MRLRYIFILAICATAWLHTPARDIELSLGECRRMALANSEDVRMAGNASRQAELDLKIANTALLPKLDATATGLYMFPDIDMSIADLQLRGTYMAGISLTQPIYTGGKITAGRNLAKIGKDVARLNLLKARMDVIAEADNAYWTLMAVNNKVTLLESYCAMMDTIYRQTHTAVEAGMAIENDLLRIDTRRSDLLYQLQKARNGAELCRLSLCRVIGENFDVVPVLVDTITDNDEPVSLDTDISSRPEVGLFAAGIRAKEQEVKMTRADFLPTVGLSLGYTYYGNMKVKGSMPGSDGSYMPFSNSLSDGYGMGILSVSIPLFHWGEGLKKVKRAKIELENSRLDMAKNTRLLSIQAIQAARNYEDGYRMIATARTALVRAEENLRVMRNRYEAALAPLTDLLDAQTQWQQASSDLIEARAQCRIYESEYLRSIGKLE